VIAVVPRDPRYPERLRDLERPPDPLWIDGEAAVLAARAVAIVGTRRMTTYGERIARELAGACVGAGLVVVSGLAQGIDSAAHRGALDAGGRTVAVLGEGITLFLATVRGRRRPLVPRIRASGALVSQYAPSFGTHPWMFAKRNATIAALAEAVVVVEAGEQSGALITAEEARRLRGRSSRSRGRSGRSHRSGRTCSSRPGLPELCSARKRCWRCSASTVRTGRAVRRPDPRSALRRRSGRRRAATTSPYRGGRTR